MPEVRALANFFDRAGKIVRLVGDEWYCEDERAGQLAAYGIAEVIGMPQEPEPEPAAEPQEEPEPEPEPKPRAKRKKKAEK